MPFSARIRTATRPLPPSAACGSTWMTSVVPDALVGGTTAINLDVRESFAADNTVIIPIVLVVIFVVLTLLLRALLAPVLLIATVVLSFAATLGVASLVFDYVFGWPGSIPRCRSTRSCSSSRWASTTTSS